MPPASSKGTAPVSLVWGEDDFTVKQKARERFASWSADSDGMDQEIIDASASNSDEALKALSRLREALNTLPFFGGSKIIWFKNCNFMGDDRTSSSQAVSPHQPPWTKPPWISGLSAFSGVKKAFNSSRVASVLVCSSRNAFALANRLF